MLVTLTRVSRRRTIATAAALGVAAGILAAGPGSAAVRNDAPGARSPFAKAVHLGASAPGERMSATFALRTRAPHPNSLRLLARQPVHSAADQATHVALLHAWQPTATAARRVTSWARARGLAVDLDDRWLVSVSGEPETMAAAFGTPLIRRAAPSAPYGRRYLVAAHPVRVPGALRDVATAVAGLDNRPLAQPRYASGPRVLTSDAGGYKPTALRTAYGVRGAGRGMTIASVQFAPLFRQGADVATYAAKTGIALAPGQFQPVVLGTANESCSTSCPKGEAEVALDLEMVLATAPRATQRIYIARQSANFELPFAAIADDAEAGLIQVATDSWGFCELAALDDQNGNPDPTGRRYVDHILRPTIDRIVAAGATLFAASGDSGAHDCLDTLPASYADHGAVAVDLPASVPETVAVGGTALLHDSAIAHPTTGQYVENAWGGPLPGDAGAGGGYSRHFARPGYQNGLTTIAPNGRRAVPDIAAVADPQTGVFECDGVFGGCGGGVGGTSAAAPLNAGALASALASAGHPFGVGDVHRGLYTADASSFRDVAAGANDTYAAGPGYDLITGLGSPIWWRLANSLGWTTATTPDAGLFHPVNPRIVLDTRPGAKIGPGRTRRIDLTRVGVPASATAAALDIEAIGGTKASSLTVYRPGSRHHLLSMGYPRRSPTTDEVTARLSNGVVKVRNGRGRVDIVVRLDGWFGASSSAAAAYHSLRTPARIFRGPLNGGGHTTLAVRGRAGVPSSATAVALRLIAAHGTRSGFLRAYPDGVRRHPAALFWRAGAPAANRVSLRLSPKGRVTLAAAHGSVRITAVVEGYWRPAAGDHGGAAYHAVDPAPLLDTRTGLGIAGSGRRLRAGDALRFFLTGVSRGRGLGIPATGVAAVVLDVRATGGTADASLLCYPAGSRRRLPAVGWAAGDRSGASVVARPGSADRYVVALTKGAVDVRVTVEGYFTH